MCARLYPAGLNIGGFSIGTKSQQALKLQQEQNKQERKNCCLDRGKRGKNNMKYPIEKNLPYAWLAMIVIAVFYAIYFAKMISQKRHGIQTHQIGSVKEKSVHRVEALMSIATLAAPVIQIMSIIFGWNHMPANARFTGFCTGMLGDLIFLISVLCMKDSWRAGLPDKDRTELVTSGIYRYSRNPAFLGFDFMYIGLLLMYFNLSMLAVSAFAIIMLHLQILQEERYLTENYGESYREYRKHVFRYLGRR